MKEKPKNSPRTPPMEMIKSTEVFTVRLKYRYKEIIRRKLQKRNM